MKRAVLILQFLLLSACGRGPMQADPAFTKHVEAFVSQASAHGRNVGLDGLVIQFGDAQGHFGFCTREIGGPTINIDSKIWSHMNETGREMLLFHELGHCVLNKSHETQLRPDGWPASVMHPDLPNWIDYRDDHETFLKELFSEAAHG